MASGGEPVRSPDVEVKQMLAESNGADEIQVPVNLIRRRRLSPPSPPLLIHLGVTQRRHLGGRRVSVSCRPPVSTATRLTCRVPARGPCEDLRRFTPNSSPLLGRRRRGLGGSLRWRTSRADEWPPSQGVSHLFSFPEAFFSLVLFDVVLFLLFVAFILQRDG